MVAERRTRRQRRAARDAALYETSARAQTAQETLQRWQQRISHAKRVREDWEVAYRVEELERCYLGHPLGGGAFGDETALSMNLFYATVQAQRPSFMPTNLTFSVEPKPGQRVRDALEARVQAGLLDTIAQQDGHLMKSLRLAMTQAFFRCGVVKCCYMPMMEANPRAGEPLLNDLSQALVGTDGESLTEAAEVVTDEVYRWQWVNARQMVLPDEGPDTTRWTWIGEEIDVSLDEAKADTRFPADVRRRLKANATVKDWGLLGGARESAEPDSERFCYVECWDILEKRVYCWAPGQEDAGFLVDEPYPDGIEDHPYALLLPVPILGPKPMAWPKPLTFDWLPLQEQYNILRTQQIEAGKRTARKILYDEHTFPDADEAQKFMASSADMQGVQVQDIGRPPLVVGDGAQSIDVTRNIQYILADWQRTSGATGTRLGSPDANTATEAVMTEQAAGVRDSEMRTLVLEFCTEFGRKMLQLIKQTLTLELWVELRGMADKDFQAFLQSEGFQAYMAGRIGAEQVAPFVQMLGVVPGMDEVLKRRFGTLKPLRVTRSMLTMEADVKAVPSMIRPLYRAQLLQLVNVLGPAALLSPTLVEELLHSFELPQGERIAEEIALGLQRQAQQAQQAQPLDAGAPGMPAGMGRMPMGAAGSPVGRNPLSVVTGGMGGT